MTTNRITLANMGFVSVNELAQMPIDHLFLLQQEIKLEGKRISNAEALLHAALDLRTRESAGELRKSAGKATGACRVRDGDLEVVIDLPKKVKWDQAGLRTIEQHLVAQGEHPAEYMDVERKVSETAFNSWPSSLRDLFEPARTVSTGKPKIEIVEPK